MVMAQALFKLLRSRQPNRPLDVLAPAWSLPIVARMPEIRAGIAAETGHGEIGFATRRRIALGMRDCYDRAIVMPRSFKSALIPWLAKIPVRTGFRGESRFLLINDVRPFSPDLLDQTVKRFVALGIEPGEALPAELPEPSLQISAANQKRVLAELGLSAERPVIAMMPGAEYGPAKCWPLEYFAALSARLDEAGYSVWIFGSDKDAAAGDAIARGSAAINLCGRTLLEDVIDLLAACEQAVSNDSGLMHIAAAVGIHVNTIPLAPRLFEQEFYDIERIEILRLLDRLLFRFVECPLGHLRCLRDLGPDLIFDKIVDKSR